GTRQAVGESSAATGYGLVTLADRLLAKSWWQRTLWALAGAAVWVALEMIVARLFGGFPWNLLGASQYQMVPLIQIASVTGIYGVSFLVIWVSLSFLSGALMLLRHPARRSAWIGEIFLPVLVVAILFNLGFRQLRQTAPAARTLKVTLIQPSIPQTLIWDPSGDTLRFQELIRLSEQALTNQTDLLVWPEAAVPKLLRYDKPTFDAVTGLARRHHVWMIVGADDAEPRRNTPNPNDADYYNSSFLISPEGQLVDRYRKRGLVIFGEYIPLQRWLPFLQFFTPIQGGFTPGDRAGQFAMPTLDVKASILICFEDIFPHIARSGVDEAIDFLVNITNNGWFGESAAQWQHATSAVFRAVENGIPLVRCSNNGLTCWVDAQGRLRQIFRDPRGTVYGVGFLTVELPVPAPGEKHALTFYTQHGDCFGWGCVAVAAGMVGWRLWRARKERRENSQPH
ncbi:MAG TPA: apolipoprotein N-acyltransferase, partial [Candidatus Sulfotelmatobacter sp.]|nr:apolipoprotein N-acyltransferase [Candidatus Sulfotelmatobacter sp.]